MGCYRSAKGNQQQALEYFNQAIALKPDYGGAYLARAVARYQLFDKQGAFQDAQIAEKLFTNQNDRDGIQTAQVFIKQLETPQTAQLERGKPSFMDFFGNVTSLLLQFLPF